MKIFIYLVCCLLSVGTLPAQQVPVQPRPLEFQEGRNKGKAILFHINIGGHIPAGDLSKRFGNHNSIGAGIERISANNWILGTEGHYLFGQIVREDPVSILRTPDGDIIGADQTLASIALRQRGLYIGALGGKLLVFNKKQRAGLRLTGGIGWLQHKIRVQDDTQSVNQLTGEYAKGYDRLTGGIALNQCIGWQKLGHNRRNNWYAGFEFKQGFTQTQRDWDFSAKKKLEGNRLDLQFGIRLAWTIPAFPKAAEKIYY